MLQIMRQLIAAADILRNGGLVAFPTETVYGLGADATNPAAVRRIFQIKGRPLTNPLIVHVADSAMARRFADPWPEVADRLAERFWPGPLTLVVGKAPAIVAEATAGLNSVALRCPRHPLALELLRIFDGPVAAPSANRSTRISPTTAQHVRDEFGDTIDCILDGGPCEVGIESTVLDLTGPVPTILRPGQVTAEQLEPIVAPVVTATRTIDDSQPASSPGQQAVHYAPLAPAYRFEPAQWPAVNAWCQSHQQQRWALMTLGQRRSPTSRVPTAGRVLAMPPAPADYARQLYCVLRQLDAEAVHSIWIEMPPDEPQWAAVRDRLLRATRPAPL
jgi:L-threonylcarbamoyladenylate synthase